MTPEDKKAKLELIRAFFDDISVGFPRSLSHWLRFHIGSFLSFSSPILWNLDVETTDRLEVLPIPGGEGQTLMDCGGGY